MQPNKINELIPSTHEMFKTRGDWDGLPELSGYRTSGATEWREGSPFGNDTKERNAYLASKLDRVTWSICDAMRARSEGDCFNDTMRRFIEADNSHDMKEDFFTLYEPSLTKSLLLTLDLMGFYGESHTETPIFMNIEIGAIEFLRGATMAAVSTADMTYNDSGIRNGILSGIVNRIIRIAELDGIDLERHMEALINYLEHSK